MEGKAKSNILTTRTDKQGDGVSLFTVLFQYLHASYERILYERLVLHVLHKGRTSTFFLQRQELRTAHREDTATVPQLGQSLRGARQRDSVGLEIGPECSLGGGDVHRRTIPLSVWPKLSIQEDI